MLKWVFLLTCYSPIFIFSQNISVQGNVINGITGYPLSNASIYLNGVLKGDSDTTGYFEIKNQSPGRKKMTCFLEGFITHEIPDLLLENGQDLTLLVRLYPWAFMGDTIFVTQPQIINELSHIHTIGVEETDRYPATFFDPARLVQTIPGVATVNDQANHLIIRGQSPNLLTWRLEGLEIVNPNHTSNAGTINDEATVAGGGVNMISAQLLSQTNFYAGQAPAQFAHGSSGTLDLKLKTGNLKNWQSTFQVGLLGIDVASEGPVVKDKISLVGNYRYSSLGLLSDLGVDIGEETIRFQDAALSLSFILPKGELKLFGFWGNSSNLFAGNPDTISTYKDLFNIDYENSIGIAGFNYSRYSKRIVWNLGSIYSKLDGSRKQDWIGASLSDRYPLNSMLSHEKIAADAHGSVELKKQGSLKLGLQALNERFGFWRFDVDNSLQGEFQVFPYFQFQKSFGLKTEISLGARYIFSNQYKARLEPNLYINYALSSQNHLALLFNTTSQLEHPAAHEPSSRSKLKPKKINASIEYLNLLNRKSHFKTVLFYQYGWNNFPSNQPHPANWFAESSYMSTAGLPFGQNTQSGIELSFKKYLTTTFFGLANLSLIESKYRSGNDAAWQDSRWDQGWITNVSFGKEISKDKNEKHRIFGINLKFNAFGGLREPMINIDESQSAWTTIYNYLDGFNDKLNASLRVDLRLSWRRSKGRRSGLLSLDIQNLLNIKNEAFTYYDPYLQTVAIQHQLGIIPILSYKYYWNYK